MVLETAIGKVRTTSSREKAEQLKKELGKIKICGKRWQWEQNKKSDGSDEKRKTVRS